LSFGALNLRDNGTWAGYSSPGTFFVLHQSANKRMVQYPQKYIRAGISRREANWYVPPRRPNTGTATRLCLTPPLPPSIHEQYSTDSNGHRRLTPIALRYKATVRKALLNLERQGILHTAFTHRLGTCYLALYIECYFETPLKRDLDNIVKITQDAICNALGTNDNRIVDIHLSKRIRPLDPHIYVEIDTLDTWEFDEEYTLNPS
jgi:crossover junction endodeoxyribonuclease RusA